MSDLRNVLIGLSHTEDMASMPNETNVQTSSLNLNSYSKPNNEFQCGEHMVAVWHDDKANCLEWYLGVVDSVDEDSVVVSYMKRSDKQGARWLFPDKAEVHKTSPDQILLRNIEVLYSLTAMIICELCKPTLEKIVDLFQKYHR